jgi:hypothetical protein
MEIRKSAAAMAALTLVILSGAATAAALAGFSLPARHGTTPPVTVKAPAIVIVTKKHVLVAPTTVPELEPDAEAEPETAPTADSVAG